MSEACTHFVPHSWKYNKCRVCDKNEGAHATSAGLDPGMYTHIYAIGVTWCVGRVARFNRYWLGIDVLLDHPELELPPHKRPGAGTTTPDTSTPAAAAAATPVTPAATVAAAVSVAVDEAVAAKRPPSPKAAAAATAAAPSSSGCTHFVPHSWKYNKCRVCERGEKDHATSAGLDPG
jgi:hypothetical protein